MTDDLRARILVAPREHQPPTHTDSQGLPPDEFECCADAVMAVLGEQFPPALVLDSPSGLSAEQVAAWQAQWAEAVSGDTTQRLVILPPNSSDLWRRRTPAERRAHLEAHRDEAIERGIPGDLVDMMIRDAEAGGRDA